MCRARRGRTAARRAGERARRSAAAPCRLLLRVGRTTGRVAAQSARGDPIPVEPLARREAPSNRSRRASAPGRSRTSVRGHPRRSAPRKWRRMFGYFRPLKEIGCCRMRDDEAFPTSARSSAIASKEQRRDVWPGTPAGRSASHSSATRELLDRLLFRVRRLLYGRPGAGPQSPHTADGDGKATAARSAHGQLMSGSSMRKTPGSASGATNVAYTVAGWAVRLRASCGSSPDSTKTEPFGEPGP